MKRALHLIFSLLVSLPAAATELPAPIDDADFAAVDQRKARIGQLLFYDKVLSGNRNISCGTCHHHDHGSADGLSLGIGEGGAGVGPERTAGTGTSRIRKRIPRNAPGLWNLGHRDATVMFHDGRLTPSNVYGNGFDSPAEEWLPDGLDSPLAAQALFPIVAQFEMAGDPSENEIAGAIHERIDAAWPIIAGRIKAIPEYGEMFVAAFDEVEQPDDISIVEIGRALAAFISTEWQSGDTPFDAYLSGNHSALSADAKSGMDLFFGEARCATCHSGTLLTDNDFHALSLPSFGPGRTRPFDPVARDVGRMGKSDRLVDAYRFRTPALRNVALTAPYGHNGAYSTLEGIVRHHLDPIRSRDAWTPAEARLPDVPWLAATDFIIMEDAREQARQRSAVDITPLPLSDDDISDLVAFLEALTGETATNRPLGRPESVPSGLPVD